MKKPAAIAPPEPAPRSQPKEMWSRLAVGVVTGLFIFLLWARLGETYRRILLEKERALARQEADRLSAILSSSVNQRAARLLGLAASARTGILEEFDGRRFQAFAAALRGGDPAIRVVAFFSPHAEALIHPPRAAAQFFGQTHIQLDSSANHRLRAIAQQAKINHQVVLSSPGELAPGTIGVFAAQAVFDGQDYLGLALIALDLDPILDLPDLPQSNSGLRFALRDPADHIFYGDPTIFESDPVLTVVMLPAGNWTLAAGPVGGWLDRIRTEMAVFWSVGAFLSLMAAAIAYLVFNRQSTLRRMVSASTTALAESEAKFRALFDNNHTAMLLIQPESGAILDANPAACAYYGYPQAALTTMKITDISTLSEAEVKAEMHNALTEQRNYFQNRHRLANKDVRDVEVFSGPIEFGGRRLFYSIIHDVTNRRQAERALQESQARYRSLLEMAPVGIGVYIEGHIRYVNPAGARLLGFSSPDQAEGRQIAEFLEPQALSDLPTFHARLMAGEQGVYPVAVSLHTQTGSTIYAEVVENLITYQGAPAFQVIFTDITERRIAQQEILAAQAELERLLAEADLSRQALLSVVEDQRLTEEKLNQLNAELELRVRQRTAQLEPANRELESFSYSASHDLRAPLRGIDGWSLALLEDYGALLDEQGRQYLERVRTETRHMGQLIDDLLRLARLARQEMSPIPVDLSAMAHRIAGRLQKDEPHRQVEFTAQPGVIVQGDPNLLEIALTNLLSNAFKFTARQPQPRVEFGQLDLDGKTACYVRDNGVGFDMANAKRLFGAFHRLHHQSEFPGTGVGLAIVQRVVHRHGGEVWAEAQKGRGATFFFTLPLISSS